MTGTFLAPAGELPPPGTMAASLRMLLPQFSVIDWVVETGSTNADLMARARDAGGPLSRPWLLGAHLQTHGRGRSGRTWQNRVGANLMFSCAFDIFLPARQLPTLAPLIGMATCQALRTRVQAGNRARLTMKWPNDLQWDQAKLAGVLIESTRSGTTPAPDHHLIIIGMGLNLCDARALSQSLGRRIADWSGIAACDAGAAAMTAADLAACAAHAWYEALNQTTAQGLANLPARYAQCDGLAGQLLDVLDEGCLRLTGVGCGVDAEGHLLVRNHDGLHAVSVGEISVRQRP